MMRRIFMVLMVLAICVGGSCAQVAPQVITATGVYIMGENDSPKIAKDAARQEAMRSAVEQAGVYVESYSKTQNYTLTEDQVKTISGAVLKVQDEKATPELSNGVWKYTVTLTAEVDTSQIDLKAMLEKQEELEKLQQERDALKKQNEELLAKYQQSQGAERDVLQKRLENQYTLSSIFEDCVAKIQRGEQHAAIAQLSDVIRDEQVTDSPLAYAYYLRGRAYYELNSDSLSLEDFAAAEKTPHDNSIYPIWRSHYYRGLIYYDHKQWDDSYNELKLAWNASDKTDDDIWEALQKADKKAHPLKSNGIDWGRILGEVIRGTSRRDYCGPERYHANHHEPFRYDDGPHGGREIYAGP